MTNLSTAQTITSQLLPPEENASLWTMLAKSSIPAEHEAATQAIVAASMMAGPRGASATAALSGAQVLKNTPTHAGLLHLAQACYELRASQPTTPALSIMVVGAITQLQALLGELASSQLAQTSENKNE